MIKILYLGKRRNKRQRPYWGVCQDKPTNKAFVYIWRFAVIMPYFSRWPNESR